MKLLLASDIHGSAWYCAKLMEAYTKGNYDKLLLLGDILYHGPRNDLPREYAPKKVIAMLNPLKHDIICVQGNCDAEVDQMVLEFDISSAHTELVADGKTFFLVHGHHPFPYISAGRYHTADWDIPTYLFVSNWKGKILHLNPGSVSLPKGGWCPTYISYAEGNFSLLDFTGTELDFSSGQAR
ncbi:MAG: phosphodiesterase [Spirochaetia bacterium]|jgi:putative phosphoesterase|nr:phosphodiesterase [Spirochaetia bacterium]